MKNRIFAKTMVILIPIAVIIFILCKDLILLLASHFPPCFFYSIYHLYCPSCGNTRSVTALLQGDILTSLRFNIVPVLSIILLTLAYIELVTYSFGKHIRILPRKLAFYMVGIALLVLYFIIRNFIPYLTP